MLDATVIDQQHTELVNMLNKLNDAVMNRETREEIYRIIDEVIAFTGAHFETEEQLMIQAGYDDIEWHKDKHRQLMEDAQHLKEKLAYAGEEMFTDWFNHWPFARVLKHIQLADQQFEDLLRQNKA